MPNRRPTPISLSDFNLGKADHQVAIPAIVMQDLAPVTSQTKQPMPPAVFAHVPESSAPSLYGVGHSNQAAYAVVKVGNNNTQAFLFETTLVRIVYDMNQKEGRGSFSIRKEGALEWTVMGSESCDFILFTLDASFTCFKVESLLPASSEIIWHFSRGSIKRDVEQALHALFT